MKKSDFKKIGFFEAIIEERGIEVMKKRFWIIGVCAVLLLIAGIIIYSR